MKNYILNITKNKKILIIVILLIISVSTISLTACAINSSKKIKTFKNEVYTLNYDPSWKIKNKKNNTLNLKHSNSGTIKIETIDLENEYKYYSIDELIDEITYNISSNNKDYKLISTNEKELTKNNYKGYKILYENKNNQVLISLFKKDEQLIVIIYEAKSKYFDILLDSVNNIIYNFDTVNKTYNIKQNISLDTDNVTFEDSKEVTNLIKDTKSYEIANNNFYVNYDIPSSFIETTKDTRYSTYRLDIEEYGKYIKLNTSLLEKNIYEYLDKDEFMHNTIYSEGYTVKNYGTGKNIKESLNELENSEYNAYIYKLTYDDENIEGKTVNKEYYKIVYELDKNHIFVVVIELYNTYVPKELVDSIKINKKEFYSSYIENIKEGAFLIGKLQDFSSYDYKSIKEVNIKIPDSYKEIDKGLYSRNERRTYVKEYNDDLEEYELTIDFELRKSGVEKNNVIKTISESYMTTYGEKEDLKYKSQITVNNYKFDEYNGGETKLSGIMYTNYNRNKYYVNHKVLIHEIDDFGYLIIYIDSIDKEVSQEVINEVVNIEIKDN